jgi:hypothetical protein
LPISTDTPGSEGWWLKKLLSDQQDRQDRLNLLDAYYRGDPPIPWGPENCQDAFRRFARKARANWASLIVEAVRERLMVTGFRTAAPDDDLGDKEADRIWQANNLPAVSQLVHRSKLAMGDAYTIVGPVDASIGAPLITAEDPRQVITASSPQDRRRVVAALKVFADEVNQNDLAYLYVTRPNGRCDVLTATRPRTSTDAAVDFGIGGWEFRTVAGLRAMPVVHFPNRADLFGRSMGEFEDVTDDIDRINLMLLQRLTVAVMQAFRQRAVKGDLPLTNTEGEVIDYADLFRADPGALWQLPAGVDMWESAGVDLTPLLESVKADVRDLAATTRTPMFYISPDAANGSAEGASLQREGLVFKSKDRITETSDPWERTMALAFLNAGDNERANRAGLRVLWQSPERFSLAERYDAASKAQAAGVPWRTVMTDVLQFEPSKVDQMEAERAQDALLAPVEPAVTGAPVAG